MEPEAIDILNETAEKFAYSEWDNVFSVYWWGNGVWRVQLFSSTGPTRWVVVENGIAREGKPYPSFV